MRLNLEPRIRRLEQRLRLRSRNVRDDRLRFRLIAAEQRMTRYRFPAYGENPAGKKAA